MDIAAYTDMTYSGVAGNRFTGQAAGAAAAEAEGTVDKEKLKQVTQQFEALFIKMMLDSMRKTVPEGTLIKKNQAEEYFEDMLYTSYSEKMASTANLGLAAKMYEQYVDYTG